MRWRAATMSTFDTRHEQIFPTLSKAEIDRLRRFGEVRRFAAGEMLVRMGEPSSGMCVLLQGSVAVTWHDGLGHVVPILDEGPGQFLAEVGQLSGRPAMVDARAKCDVEALIVPTESLRAVLVAESELGERIVRALILRRVLLIETGAGGPTLIGSESNPDLVRLDSFLTRNGYPHQVLDPETDRDAQTLTQKYAPSDLPLVACPDGTVLKNPSELELARCIG